MFLVIFNVKSTVSTCSIKKISYRYVGPYSLMMLRFVRIKSTLVFGIGNNWQGTILEGIIDWKGTNKQFYANN